MCSTFGSGKCVHTLTQLNEWKFFRCISLFLVLKENRRNKNKRKKLFSATNEKRLSTEERTTETFPYVIENSFLYFFVRKNALLFENRFHSFLLHRGNRKRM